jgi:hypothetical protein
MFEEQISQAIQVFNSLEGAAKLAFTFWMTCAAVFYGMLVYIVVLLIKEVILKISRLSRI